MGQRKGSLIYVAGDKAYIKNKEYQKTIILKCKYYRNCTGRGRILKDGFLYVTRPHSCHISPADIGVLILKQKPGREGELDDDGDRGDGDVDSDLTH